MDSDDLVQRFPVSVKGVCVQGGHQGKVLLLHNERDEWELPGGKLKLGENPIECLAREVFEESGWSVTVGPILDSWVCRATPDANVVIVTYGCIVDATQAPQVSSEHDRARLFELGEVPKLRMPEDYRKSIFEWVKQLATLPIEPDHELTNAERRRSDDLHLPYARL